MTTNWGGRRVVTHESSYLFVDGGYLRKCYKDALEVFYEVPIEPEISFENLRTLATYQTSINRKCYFYDCLSEGDPTTHDMFQRINAADSWHVHYGVLRGTRNVRQKHIDTLMAVEMLTHAFNGNAKTMILIAGDSDHLPVIDALNRLGVTTVLLGADHNTAADLKDASDVYQPITFRRMHDWLNESFKGSHWNPNSDRAAEGSLPSGVPIYTGYYSEGLQVRIFGNEWEPFAIYDRRESQPRRIQCSSVEKLKLYLHWTLPRLSWTEI